MLNEKDGVLEEGMQLSFDHHCPPLAKGARLVIETHEILPVNMGG